MVLAGEKSLKIYPTRPATFLARSPRTSQTGIPPTAGLTPSSRLLGSIVLTAQGNLSGANKALAIAEAQMVRAEQLAEQAAAKILSISKASGILGDGDAEREWGADHSARRTQSRGRRERPTSKVVGGPELRNRGVHRP